ncbi:putative nuclease harbi1 [Mactra antiquata]
MAVPLFILNENTRAQRHFRRWLVLDDLRDIDIVSRYRFDRQTIEFLIDLLSPDLEKDTDRTRAIHTETQAPLIVKHAVVSIYYVSSLGFSDTVCPNL